jgi:hypothetical protein
VKRRSFSQRREQLPWRRRHAQATSKSDGVGGRRQRFGPNRAVGRGTDRMDGEDWSEENQIRVSVRNFQHPVEFLEGDDGANPIDVLSVSWRRNLPSHIANDFRRFVAALGRARAVRGIEFHSGDWETLPVHDADRLFGRVLPGHPTLRYVGFDMDNLPARQVRLLTSSIPAATNDARLLKLNLSLWTVDHESAQAIADMIHRHVALSKLVIAPLGEGMDADDCQLICRAVSSNNALRSLSVRVKEMCADTLDRVLASTSLRELRVVVLNEIPDEAVATIAGQLRTNTALSSLSVVDATDVIWDDREEADLFRPVLDALETHNYSIPSAVFNWRSNTASGPSQRPSRNSCAAIVGFNSHLSNSSPADTACRRHPYGRTFSRW